MALFDVESLILKAADNPAIQKVIAQVTDVCNGVILGMAHFNKRFDALEAKQDANDMKLERIYQHVAYPSDIAPAGDDGLMKLLADGGEAMQIVEVTPMPESNNDGSTKLIQ